METDMQNLQHQNDELSSFHKTLNSYEKTIGRLIVKGRLADGLPPLDNKELFGQSRTWAEIVCGEIPDSYLNPAYVEAMRVKDSFPLGASDLVTAYRALCESERSAPRQAQHHNQLPGEVCQKCFGTGWEQYVADGGYKAARRCDHVVGDGPLTDQFSDRDIEEAFG